MKRTLTRADAEAIRADIDAQRGYPRTHTDGDGELVRVGGGIHVDVVRTETAVAIDGDGADVTVVIADADERHIEPSRRAQLRARFEGAPRPEGDRLPASSVGPVRNGIERMLPVVLLANTLHLPQAIEVAPGVTELLWDTSYSTSYGTRYVRADGTREFVVQPVAALGAQHVAILWSAGSDSDAGEAAYIAAMLAVAVAAGLIEEHWSCTRSGGLWLPDSLRGDVAAVWPAEWRSAGAPCVGPAQ